MRLRATRLFSIGSGRRLSPAPILDQLGITAAAAYSLRQVRSAASLACRVRRSADNAEANFGFATAAQTRTNLAAIPINNNAGATAAGVTMTVTGTGTEFGQPYVEVRWQGTASAADFLQFNHSAVGAFNPTIHAPVAPGLTYTTSIGFRLVSGTAPSGALFVRGKQCNNAGSFIGGTGVSLGPATSTLQRGAGIAVAAANAAFIQPNIYMSVNNGEVVDATIRFYAANVELGVGNARPLLQRNVPETVAAIGELDAEALLSFVGSGNGFVTTWYDQSGNGRNAAQTTASVQPRIVNAGVIDIANDKPAIRFNGSNTFFSGVSLPLSQLTLSSVLNDVTQASTIRYSIGTGSGTPGRGIFSSFTGSPNASLGYIPDAGTPVVQTGFLPTIGQSYVVSLTTTATASSIWANGGNNATGGRITLNQLFIGQRGDGQWYYDGYNSETIVFPSALSTADRQLLERNQGQYYGVAVA
jgi:hypothetical protein